MSYRVLVICDRCSTHFGWEDCSIGITFAKKIAREEGWSIGKQGWLCPNCKKMNRKKVIRGV